MTGLERAIEVMKGVTKLAAVIGVKPQTVSMWKGPKRGIPPEKVLAIAAATGWKVTPHELAPSLYPHPADGMPRRRRTKTV